MRSSSYPSALLIDKTDPLSLANENSTAAVSKYLFTHAVIQAGRERWADIDDEERGSSFRFTFARNVKVHLMCKFRATL